MTGHFVILSGAYCSPDIVAEYGRIPPAFLPVSGRRLFELQLDLAEQQTGQPTMTLPADFEVEPYDAEMLQRRNVRIVRSPPSLMLAEAVQFVLEVLSASGEIVLLHGDTLIEHPRLPAGDCIATQSTHDYYEWADVSYDGWGRIHLVTSLGDGHATREVACGFFRFLDGELLRRTLIGENDFIRGINAYAAQRRMRAERVAQWYDFGHLPRIFQSKRNMLVSRAFNSLESDGVAVVKRSAQVDKIAAEMDWYRSVPEPLRAHIPQFLGGHVGEKHAWFRLEYLYQENVGELFVFGRLPSYIWRRILNACISLLDKFAQVVPNLGDLPEGRDYPKQFYDILISGKSRKRLREFCSARGWSTQQRVILNGQQTPPLETVVEQLIGMIPVTSEADICLWHGDYFFGNMFYDFRSSRVRLVDPRGGVSGLSSPIYGDRRYDLAKLAHSIHGRYDLLAAGRAHLHTRGPCDFEYERPTTWRADAVEAELAAMEVRGTGALAPEVRAMSALLFLSMLPLHDEAPERQNLLLANGLALHRALCGSSA